MKTPKPTQLIHKEYHWKDGVKYLLQYFRTKDGIKSRMTKINDSNDGKSDV